MLQQLSASISHASAASIPSSENAAPTVPPSTPASNFSFETTLRDNPPAWPRLTDDSKIPYIREVGIKNSLEILSGYLQCPDYKINPIQFWFLDIIADCIWRMQDEYQFPQQYQRVIVHWVLFVMELIRDPKKNLTRKKFFKIFAEALMIAEEHIQTGCEMLPEPSALFILVPDEEEEKISLSSATSSEAQDSSFKPTPFESLHGSYVAIGADEDAQYYKLPESKCLCKYIPTPRNSCDEQDYLEAIDGDEGEQLYDRCSYESIEFYKPDPNIPDRFLSDSSSSSSYDDSDFTKNLTSFNNESKEEEQLQEVTAAEEEVKSEKSYIARFIWDDCSISSEKTRRTCPLGDSTPAPGRNTKVFEEKTVKKEWLKYLEDQEAALKDVEKNIFINTCALFAVKQFVYDYFYETFQFTLAKLSLMTTHNLISQKVNTDWMVPKVLKQELKKPKIPKEKKPKKQKEKKPKKPKKEKKKKSAKDKKSKKSSKKSKKEKKHKLTKEEKAELARLKKEQERLEEEARKAEENRRLLFPLKDAASDEFFKNIFDHWVKPKAKKDKKKKKK